MKINTKETTDFNLKPKVVKLLVKKKTGQIIWELGLYKEFLISKP